MNNHGEPKTAAWLKQAIKHVPDDFVLGIVVDDVSYPLGNIEYDFHAKTVKVNTGSARACVRSLVQRGCIIEAVKLYREMTHSSLVEARDVVYAIRDSEKQKK